MTAAELEQLMTQVRQANEAEDWASAIVLYQRVLVEARRTAWGGGGPEVADALCARACFGLAECALAERRFDEARAYLERALALTTRYALDSDRRALIVRIAETFEHGLGDALQANRLRRMLRD
jgi:tetratricopeptide (TPR) repeat protein